MNLTDFNDHVLFEAGKTLEECHKLIEMITHNCECIYFEPIPIKYQYNHHMNQWEICTTYENTKALEYCLKDMYWN